MDLNGLIADHLSRGETGSIVTIVEKLGSGPRDEGASMFVTAKGQVYGTIGGGSLEAYACIEAGKVLETGRHQICHYAMDGQSADESDMICGGSTRIFIEPANKQHELIYRAASNAIKRAMQGFIVTRYSRSECFKSFLAANGTVEGDPLDDGTIATILTAGNGLIFSDELIVQPVLSRSPLYIFGAGHVSQHICRIANMINFDVTVIDDRADYANADRFPDAGETIVQDFATVFDSLSFSGSEYVVIVTRGHKHDSLVLEYALRQPTRYLGMIGSHRKTLLIFDHLKKKGFDGDALLARVFAPIGLDIGAETPEEIAVSIVAELIRVQNKPDAEQNLSMKQVKYEGPRYHAPDHHQVLFG
ncbi:MAG TPA: XdhC/CoxI family protein [Syntrophorhabdaceae bacterium]|nr:XdhC/CoxI family protein [Syntrophorhabdaceae bacterium]